MEVANLLWHSAARTDTGKVRARNEDAFLDQPQCGLWVVADGMGGHQNGDLASRLIVESLGELDPAGSFEQRLECLRDCLHRLNRHLSLGLTVTSENPDMLVGSTVVALLAAGSRVACVWAGDSRCYLLRGRQLYQLSRDHSLLQQLVDERGMSAEEAARQPAAHALTRAIGAAEELQLDILELESLPGDVFLLCSDGLYQDLDPDQLSAALIRPSADLTLMVGSTAKAPRPLPKDLPEVLCGRYRIERLLGVGGMGAVYRARDLLREQFGDPQPHVALKTLSEDFAEYPDANALLYSEFALGARLNQRNLIRLYSFEVDPPSQRAFITMELLKGCTLDHLLQQYPNGLPWAEAHTISLSLLEALHYAHGQGVLHGDLKPSNLMLGDDQLRLFDFGLGQALDGFLTGLPRLSRSRFAAWTPRYAAPELLDGAPLSVAADVYALACVIYELCSGQHPFRRQSAKQAKAMELPLHAPADLPRALWPALRAALEFDPVQRSSLPRLLRAFRDQQRPASRLPRWLRRQPAL